MKSKLFIAICIIFALNACLFWSLRPRRKAAPVLLSETEAPTAAIPDLVPVNSAKLNQVANHSTDRRSGSFQPVGSDWNAISVIIDTTVDVADRLRAVDTLSPDLSEDDAAKLQEFLLKPDALDEGQDGQVLKNRVMDVLCAVNPPAPTLGDVLSKLFHDYKQNEVLRDYAIQHLAEYYEQIAVLPQSGPARKSIQKVLWEAARESGGSIEGTALLALGRLSQDSRDFDQQQIADMARRMAANPLANEMTHITAYQVCGRLGAKDVVPLILQAAQNGETIPVRLSAIAALGQIGGTDQTHFLRSIVEGDEDRLKPAARYALARIAASQNAILNR